MIATNDDATYPGEDGLSPGAGSLLAAVVTASGVQPTVAGKPFPPMVDLVRAMAGPDGVAVGDRADTDGRFARALGYRFGLVLTGVTTAADLPVDPAPDAVGADLAALVEQWIARAVVSARRRLDDELVRRRLAPSRNQAQADIAAGRVLVGGATADKPARLVLPGDAIVVQSDGPRFVSRAGSKLDAALDRFTIDVAGRRVLDAGASTGGFSDCVLQRGAAEVVAVDVGHGQLHERVATDRRVRVLDRTNVRELDPATVGEPVDLVTADLSFISLRLVLDPLLAVVRPGGDLVLLVKPQFEAGRQVVSKGRGIVSDPQVWRDVLLSVMSATDDRGATIMGAMASPITGTDGNVEFLLHVCADDGAPRSAPDLDAMAAAAVAEAEDARRLRER